MFVYKDKAGVASTGAEDKKDLERSKHDEMVERSLANALDSLHAAGKDSTLSSLLELASTHTLTKASPSSAALPRNPVPRMERTGDEKPGDGKVTGTTIADPMVKLQEWSTGQWPGTPEAKEKRKESLSKLAEWLRLMGFQNQLWGSSCLVGAVRQSQIALMIEFELVGGGTTVAHDFIDNMKA